MQQKKLQWLLVTGFLIGVGAWLLGFSWLYVQKHERLEKSSVVVDGRMISSAKHPLSRGGQTYTLVVEYKPAEHPAITKEFDVDGTDYKEALDTGKTKVSYLPEDPHVSLVTHFAILPFQILIGLGGIILFAGLFCLASGLRTKAMML
jgi:Protein of unknown function (DUF3592)